MPEKPKLLFGEAGVVFQHSPRAAAALLRLALQHLLVELDQPGKNINSDINALIDKGLDPDIAKSMHAVRIIGNESVHPGVIDVDDEPSVAEIMFDLMNQIVGQMITRPNQNADLWEKLPESKREEVEVRLAKAKKPNSTD
ncbi:MAG: DUF4145 domain-containing protein [Rhodobacteraceae bacterium]|nr:DUF4145 domain-containing protein [Paracoccaceae bacterium]